MARLLPLRFFSRENKADHFGLVLDQPPGRLHQGPPQQSRAFLGDLQVLGLLAAALPHRRHQSRVGADRLGVAEPADVSQLAEHHLGRHKPHPRGRLEDRPGFLLPLRAPWP